MVHLQIISRDGSDVQAELRAAIQEQRMTTFEIEGIRGGMRLRHKRFKGEVHFLPTRAGAPALLSVRSKLANEEWQLLSALIGRLADRFRSQIVSINMQLEPPEQTLPKGKARGAARKRAGTKKKPRRSVKASRRRKAKAAVRTRPRRSRKR